MKRMNEKQRMGDLPKQQMNKKRPREIWQYKYRHNSNKPDKERDAESLISRV